MGTREIANVLFFVVATREARRESELGGEANLSWYFPLSSGDGQINKTLEKLRGGSQIIAKTSVGESGRRKKRRETIERRQREEEKERL